MSCPRAMHARGRQKAPLGTGLLNIAGEKIEGSGISGASVLIDSDRRF